MATWHSILWVYHNLFNQVHLGGHLGFFHGPFLQAVLCIPIKELSQDWPASLPHQLKLSHEACWGPTVPPMGRKTPKL